MNTIQEIRLQAAAANLSRADEENNRGGVDIAHMAIRDAVTEIYKTKIDTQTVLQVEKILNSGYANMAGITSGKDKEMGKLAERAAVGFDMHKQFEKNPKGYVASVEMANRDMGKFPGEGKRFSDGVPIDSIRGAFTQLRKQLSEDLQQISPQVDKKATDRLRFDATIKAERLFLEKYLANRTNETERKKQEHLQEFDKRMERAIKRVEPREREKQQEKQQEPPRRSQEQKRSKGLSR